MRSIILTLVCILSGTFVFAQNTSSDEIALRTLSENWMIATMNRDQNTLNQIVSAEFKLAGTDLEEPPIPRDIWMKNTMENLKIDSVNYNKFRIDIIGDVAVVQSVFYWSVAYLNSPAKEDIVNLVDTWIRRNESWQVVSRLVVE